jgi:nicotinamide-nucleotide amidase
VRHLVALLVEQQATIAVAESLTGGLLGAAITGVPGVSSVFRGGITPYATDLKASLAEVNPDLLARLGPVSAEVALALAHGARSRLDATFGLATTGVAGPDPQAGENPGTVYVACVGVGAERFRRSSFGGDRTMIRQQAVRAALSLAIAVVRTTADGSSPSPRPSR